MIRRIAWTAVAGVFTCACLAGNALTDEEVRSAVVGEGISLPAPGELIAAFDKAARPDWSTSFRKVPDAAFTSRPQIAINLGLLLADGHVAVEAQDRQELKNVSREVKNLAKALGLEQDIVRRSNTIADFADGMQWDALSEELEAVQNELAAAMSGRQDGDLVTLLVLGAWLRAIEVVSGHLAASYTPAGAKTLRQPAIGSYFIRRLTAMPARIQGSTLVAELQRRLPEIHALLSQPAGATPSAADAAKLKELTSGLVTSLITQEK
ncbi:MAG: hypothetical protein ABMA01_15625 [Chthoniobacteraceae bacterium]